MCIRPYLKIQKSRKIIKNSKHRPPPPPEKKGTTVLDHASVYTLEHAQLLFNGSPNEDFHLSSAIWRLLDASVHKKLRELLASVDDEIDEDRDL